MAKSPDAFRTISEVADWLDTPAHVLRFWESRFTQVKPVKRAGGRRYYRPADMLLLGGIKKLLHEDGMTIKGAQKLLREDGIKKVSALSQPLDAETDDAIELKAVANGDAPAEVIDAPISEPAPTSVPLSVVPTKETSPAAIPDPVPTASPVAEAPVAKETKTADVVTEEPDVSTPAPRPDVVTTPPDPADDTETEAEPSIAAQLRSETPSTEDSKKEALTSIYSRLSALHDRMKASIDPKQQG